MKLFCYIRYFVISVVINNTKQSNLFNWDQSFVIRFLYIHVSSFHCIVLIWLLIHKVEQHEYHALLMVWMCSISDFAHNCNCPYSLCRCMCWCCGHRHGLDEWPQARRLHQRFLAEPGGVLLDSQHHHVRRVQLHGVADLVGHLPPP